MPFEFLNARARAAGFVALAVCATVAVALLVDHHGSPPQPRILGPGAAPPAGSQPVTQHRVYGTNRSAQRVSADSSGASELVPLTPADFARPIAGYRAYAARRVAALAIQVGALTTALRAGDRGAARTAWQRADSTFQRIGAAYGALGALGDAIDGGPGGLPRGTADRRFAGLQRIELGLWSGASVPSLTPYAARLGGDVRRVRRTLLRAPIDSLTYATRAHEILEDVQRDRLSFPTPSDSGVRATADGVATTKVVLGTLTPLLSGRGDALTRSLNTLRGLSATLAAIRRAHGGYPTGSALSLAERQRLDGRLGAALEALDGIPGELETKRPPAFARNP